MEPDCKITVTRTAEDDIKQRQVILKLDGERIGQLLFGQSLTRPMSAGHHLLQADNTWNKKKLAFSVEPGEEAKFKVVNRAGGCTWMLVGALGAGPMYVSIEPEI
jgi:hypothetical protein